jgi:hypothetical protein
VSVQVLDWELESARYLSLKSVGFRKRAIMSISFPHTVGRPQTQKEEDRSIKAANEPNDDWSNSFYAFAPNGGREELSRAVRKSGGAKRAAPPSMNFVATTREAA